MLGSLGYILSVSEPCEVKPEVCHCSCSDESNAHHHELVSKFLPLEKTMAGLCEVLMATLYFLAQSTFA